ncbi:phytoene/squalene synthase family protein [Congregibacter sp.]|uniref:phytoene/squalene synthase family protein n=1 Tax=Congregibacter sp. TaxID=2744308 RepID=UPI003858A3F1
MPTVMPDSSAGVAPVPLRSRKAIPPDARSDTAYCRAMIRTGSKSFFLASHLLPPALRGAVYALYAFCREADDAIDDGADPLAELAIFRKRLGAVYGEEIPGNVVDRALARVVRDHALPRELLEALLQGFAWDVQSRAYKDLGGVYGYGVRVAGSVGVMMALLMGVRDPGMLARAADLGVAMQLTNIARDVGEDARAGRVYLPMRWLREVGLSPQGLVDKPQHSPELASVVARLLSAAECLYARADSGIAGLPARCRPGIYAARKLYAGIGHELLRRGGDSVSRRTVLPNHRKLLLTLSSLVPPRVNLAHLNADPLPQVRYLIRAVDSLPTPEAGAQPPLGFAGDIDWVMNVFAELEKRDREVHSSESGFRSSAAS